MRGGRLDRRVDIQRNTPTRSPSGELTESWADIASNIPASVSPLAGDERFSQPQTVATDQVEFRIRYFGTVAALTPLDRVVYPSSVSNSPVEEKSIYDILQVSEIGRHEGLRILAARKPDAVT